MFKKRKKQQKIALFEPWDLVIHHEQSWAEFPLDLQHKAINYLKEKLPSELLAEVAEAHAQNGDEWLWKIHEDFPFYSFHFYEGMGIRNLLRDIIPDRELPSGNWDDYYVAALERAAGCR